MKTSRARVNFAKNDDRTKGRPALRFTLEKNDRILIQPKRGKTAETSDEFWVSFDPNTKVVRLSNKGEEGMGFRSAQDEVRVTWEWLPPIEVPMERLVPILVDDSRGFIYIPLFQFYPEHYTLMPDLKQ